MADATLTVDAEDRATMVLNHIHSRMLDMIEITEDMSRGFKNVYQEMDKLAAAEHKRNQDSEKARAAEAKAAKMAVAEINQTGKARLQEGKQVHDLERDQAKQAGKENLEVVKSNLQEEGAAKKHARTEESAANEAARDAEDRADRQRGAERIEWIKQLGKEAVAQAKKETQEMNAERRSGLSDEVRARQRLHKQERANVKKASNEDRGIRKAILDESIQDFKDQADRRASVADEKLKESLESAKNRYRQEKTLNDQARKEGAADQKQTHDEEYRQLLLAQERELNALKMAGKEFKDEDQKRHAEQRAEMKIAQREARESTNRHYDLLEDGIREAHRTANAIAKAGYDEEVDRIKQGYTAQKREITKGVRANIREKKQGYQLAAVEAKAQDDNILALMDRRHAEELDKLKHVDRKKLEEVKAGHKRERDEYIEFSRELRDERLHTQRQELADIGQDYKKRNREADIAYKRELADRKHANDKKISENDAFHDEELARNNHARMIKRQRQKHDQDMEMERFQQHNREKLKEQKKSNNKLLGDTSQTSQKMLKMTAAMFSIAGVTLAAHKIREFGLSISEALVKIEGMKLSLIAVEGNAERANQQLLRIRDIANLPGVELESAIKTTVTLRALKLEADLVERSVVAIGNALAILGRESELGGVTLAISQILGKGKIQAEEINQIAERMPFIRGILVDEFGTANTEILQKMEVNTEHFIRKITEGLEKLPKVATTIGTSLKNMRNEWFVFRASLGTLLKPSIMTAIEGATALLNRANESLDRANKQQEERTQQREAATKSREIVEGMGMGDVQPFSDYLRSGLPTNIGEVRRQLEEEQEYLQSRLDNPGRRGSAKVQRPLSDVRRRVDELQTRLDTMLKAQNPVELTVDELEKNYQILIAEIERQQGMHGTRQGSSKLAYDASEYLAKLLKARDLLYWTLWGKTAKGGMADVLETERKKTEAAAMELQLYEERMQNLLGDKLIDSIRGKDFLGNRRKVIVGEDNLPQIVSLEGGSGLDRFIDMIEKDLADEVERYSKNKIKIAKEIDPNIDKILDTAKRKTRREEVINDALKRLNDRAKSLISSVTNIFQEQGAFWDSSTKQWELFEGVDSSEFKSELDRRKSRDVAYQEKVIKPAQLAGLIMARLDGRIKQFWSGAADKWIDYEEDLMAAMSNEWRPYAERIPDEFKSELDRRKARDAAYQEEVVKPAQLAALIMARVDGRIKQFWSGAAGEWIDYEEDLMAAMSNEWRPRAERIPAEFKAELDRRKARDVAFQEEVIKPAQLSAQIMARLDGRIKQFWSGAAGKWVDYEEDLMAAMSNEWRPYAERIPAEFKAELDRRKARDAAYQEEVIKPAQLAAKIMREVKFSLFKQQLTGQSNVPGKTLDSSFDYSQLPKETQDEIKILESQRKLEKDRYKRPGDEYLPEDYQKALAGSRKESEAYDHQVQDQALQTANTIISAWDKVTEHTDTMVDNVVASIAQTAVNMTQMILNIQRASAAAGAAGAAGGLKGTLAKFGAYGAIAAGAVALGSSVYSIIDQHQNSQQERNRIGSRRPVSISGR